MSKYLTDLSDASLTETGMPYRDLHIARVLGERLEVLVSEVQALRAEMQQQRLNAPAAEPVKPKVRKPRK